MQENWELREVAARCLRWVNRNNPPAEPVALTRREALPENLRPCGVWGDLLESPTEREELGPPPVWPPPDLEALEMGECAGLVLPAVRSPAEREESVVAVARAGATTPAVTSPAMATRSKRARLGTGSLPGPVEGAVGQTPSSQSGAGGRPPTRPSTERGGSGEVPVAERKETGAVEQTQEEREGTFETL